MKIDAHHFRLELALHLPQDAAARAADVENTADRMRIPLHGREDRARVAETGEFAPSPGKRARRCARAHHRDREFRFLKIAARFPLLMMVACARPLRAAKCVKTGSGVA